MGGSVMLFFLLPERLPPSAPRLPLRVPERSLPEGPYRDIQVPQDRPLQLQSPLQSESPQPERLAS